MRASDKDGNGQINFEEFLAVVLSKVKVSCWFVFGTHICFCLLSALSLV
jgi:hypothetical protein